MIDFTAARIRLAIGARQDWRRQLRDARAEQEPARVARAVERYAWWTEKLRSIVATAGGKS